MIIIKSIFFFLINWYGWKFVANQKTFTVKSMWEKERRLQFSGPEMFVLLTLGCGIIASDPGGILAVRLLLWEILLIVGISFVGIQIDPVTVLYGIYLLFGLCNLKHVVSLEYYSHVFLKYLFPFLILLYVPKVVKNKDIVWQGFSLVYKVFAVWCVTDFLGNIGLGILVAPVSCLWWWGPAILDVYGVIVSISLVLFYEKKDKRYLILILACAIIPMMGYVIRTGLLVLFVSLMTTAFFHYKVRALPYFLLMLVIGICIIVFIPQVRDKMFRQDYTSDYLLEHYSEITWDNIDDNGRSNSWKKILNMFYDERELCGSGWGTTQHYMEWAHNAESLLAVAHNDYVQILCDTGLIGLFLYALSSLILIFKSFCMYNNRNLLKECRYSALVAGVTLTGLLFAMGFDNVVNYSMCTFSFAYIFYGISIALSNQKNVEAL